MLKSDVCRVKRLYKWSVFINFPSLTLNGNNMQSHRHLRL